MTTWKTYRVRTQSGASENFRHLRNADHFDVGQKAAAVAESLGGPIDGARVYMLRPELDGTPSEGTPGYLRPIHGGTAWKVMGADEPEAARVHAQAGPDQGLGAEGAEAEGDLYSYQTGEWIRPATAAEVEASSRASKTDGGVGVIEIDGFSVYAMR